MSAFIQRSGRGSAGRAVYRHIPKNGAWRWYEEDTGKPFSTSVGEIRAIIDTREITEIQVVICTSKLPRFTLAESPFFQHMSLAVP
jgi:hypothetical protein